MRTVLSIVLRPFSWIYAIGVGVRNAFFDGGVLRSVKFEIPVLSVGNITVGGTGKTPHVAYLCELLSAHSYRVAVLSRGYGRKTKGFLWVSTDSRASEVGDEPCMLKQHYPSIVVAVDEDRVHGVQTLLSSLDKPDIILLDDAFQHRYVSPRYAVLLVDYHRPLYKDTYLPAGRMRESFSGRHRAQMVILTKTPSDITLLEVEQERKRYRLNDSTVFMATSMAYGLLKPVFPEAAAIPRTLRPEGAFSLPEAVLMVTAIANPEPLYTYLQKCISKIETLSFPDHHAFSHKDVDRLVQTFESMPSNNKCMITTEKDAVRWRDVEMPDALKSQLYYLPIHVVFPLQDENVFEQNIIQACL